MLQENVCERPRGRNNVVDNMILMRRTLKTLVNKGYLRHKIMGYFEQVGFPPKLDDSLILSQNRLQTGHYFPFKAENRPEMMINIPQEKTW
jgi:hypothetical protein